MKLKRTKEPVTSIAGAIAVPEPLCRLTWCYVPRAAIFTLMLGLLSGCHFGPKTFIVMVGFDSYVTLTSSDDSNGFRPNIGIDQLRERLASLEEPDHTVIVFMVAEFKKASPALVDGIELTQELGFRNVRISTIDFSSDAKRSGT